MSDTKHPKKTETIIQKYIIKNDQEKLPANFIFDKKLNKTNVMINQTDIVFSEKDISTKSNINVNNGTFDGDIDANNATLIGDISSTNLIITADARVDGTARINNLDVIQATINENLAVTTINADLIKCPMVETTKIYSPTVLDLSANLTIRIPNIQYRINLSNNPLIEPPDIKYAKIFIVDHNVIINADPTCDGMEIIIYNKHYNTAIIIRDQIQIICEIGPQKSIKIIFLAIISKWILC